MRFETRFTYDFVRRSLPRNCRRILEIGCGTGELAARLSKDGYAIIAIDSDGDSIAAARKMGADAHVATWPDLDDSDFDAVLFTRSLHHIHPLDQAVKRAADSLTDGGRAIVEDFAYESTDEKTLRWFAGAIRALKVARVLIEPDELLAKTETLQAWRQNHDPDLHAAREIGAQLENVFEHVIKEDAPYYFRYLASAIVATDKRDTILQALAEEEATLASDDSIVALGRRFIAMRNKS